MQPTADFVSVFQNAAFRRESFRSEMVRTLWMILGVGLAVAFMLFRGLYFQGEHERNVLTLTVWMGVGVLIYEGLRLLFMRRLWKRDAFLPEWAWFANVAIESLVPTAIILWATKLPTIGPYRALLIPVILLYGLVFILSIMRLRPWFTYVAALLSAGSYAAAVVYTFFRFPVDSVEYLPAREMSYYLTYGIFILVCGIAAGAVARKVREHVGIALWETQERQRLQLAARNTLIFGLAKLAEFRDTDTGTHLDRIAEYTEILGDALQNKFPQLTRTWLEELRVASAMHDIGKVGIPDGVLLKPGVLNQDERKVIEKHPGIGHETLQAILKKHGSDTLLQMSAEIAMGHHERWDGGGYPIGQKGEEIALTARIISVADVYDALTSERVYRNALSHEEAVRMIQEGSGKQFDPNVVEAFMAVLDDFERIRQRHFG